jgi:hypothetical protein
MFKSKTSIWRGENDLNSILGKDGVAIIDTTKSERKSQNTSNWYTLIIDNSPKYKNYPKRSQSLICTNKITTTGPFGSPMAIIPFNNAKIGVVNAPDIWDKSIVLGDKRTYISDVNDYFNMLKKFGLSDTNWQSFIDFDKKLKTDKKFKNSVEKGVNDNPIKSLLDDDFVNKVLKMYDDLGFELLTPKQYGENPPKTNTELWIGGKVLCLNENIFNTLCNEFKNENI